MPKSSLNFLFVPYHNTGGHFLCWSLYYLRGQTEYIKNGKIWPVPDPINLENKKNFHHYRGTYVNGQQDYLKIISDPQSYNSVESMNFYLMPDKLADYLLDHYGRDFEDCSAEEQKNMKKILIKNTSALLQDIQDRGFNLMVFDFAQQDLYSIFYNDRAPQDWQGAYVDDQSTSWRIYQDDFFPDIDKQFPGTEIWDLREKLALLLKPHNFYRDGYRNELDWKTCVNEKKAHLYYNTDDVWNALDTVIPEICEFVGIENIPEDRMEQWKKVYYQWRLIHDQWFSRHLDRIIDAIVHNRYLCLKRFNLNFYKEALIQHMLITRHNLNLKTWQLTKFPDNTQDLHRLLEPNIHVI